MTILLVKVVPKARENAIAGWEGDELKVRIAEPPEKGKANKALEGLLAKKLKLPKSSVVVTGGLTSRHKKVNVQGMDLEKIKELLCCED